MLTNVKLESFNYIQLAFSFNVIYCIFSIVPTRAEMRARIILKKVTLDCFCFEMILFQESKDCGGARPKETKRNLMDCICMCSEVEIFSQGD